MEEHVALKKALGDVRGRWVLHDWRGVASSTFCDWRARYGQVNEHNGWVPRDRLEVGDKPYNTAQWPRRAAIP